MNICFIVSCSKGNIFVSPTVTVIESGKTVFRLKNKHARKNVHASRLNPKATTASISATRKKSETSLKIVPHF